MISSRIPMLGKKMPKTSDKQSEVPAQLSKRAVKSLGLDTEATSSPSQIPFQFQPDTKSMTGTVETTAVHTGVKGSAEYSLNPSCLRSWVNGSDKQ